uniref:E3 ubiquitin-protein ligase TRIM39-like isoform X2 n=1 Tax=Geotrypetes seraphini TaxID=260995 RepID=A0A6P8RLX4_GEOSA|nr:E3 ubiquitin-protein ligase TRIM39-like isoform X2 [Geotrypetes seraphini]
MAAVHPVESLQEEASCSICLDYFTDPVITDCGHNFCRSCITQFWEGRDTASPCPQCRRMSRMSTLRPNRQLANMTEMVKKLGQTPKRPNQESRCEKHEESLTLFCKEDQRALCLQCTKSQDHRFHRVIPVEEAEQEYKENLKRCLNPLRKDLEDLLKFKSAEEKKAEELKSETQIQRQTVESVFEELHQTLNKKKQVLLSRLEEEEKKILERIRENVTQVEEQSSSLMQLISEIEEKGQQLVAKSVKDVRDAFIRYHKMKLPGPEAVSIDLKIGFSLSYPQQLKEVIAKFGDWWMECGRTDTATQVEEAVQLAQIEWAQNKRGFGQSYSGRGLGPGPGCREKAKIGGWSVAELQIAEETASKNHLRNFAFIQNSEVLLNILWAQY